MKWRSEAEEHWWGNLFPKKLCLLLTIFKSSQTDPVWNYSLKNLHHIPLSGTAKIVPFIGKALKLTKKNIAFVNLQDRPLKQKLDCILGALIKDIWETSWDGAKQGGQKAKGPQNTTGMFWNLLWKTLGSPKLSGETPKCEFGSYWRLKTQSRTCTRLCWGSPRIPLPYPWLSSALSNSWNSAFGTQGSLSLKTVEFGAL